MFKEILSVIVILLLFVGILYLAYITTKFIGKRYSVKGKSFNNMKILDTASIGQDRQLMIVKAAERVFLIGVTSNQISLISELDEEKLEIESAEEAQSMDFSDALKKVLKDKFSSKKDVGKADGEDGKDAE